MNKTLIENFTSTVFLHQQIGTCLSKVRGTRHYRFNGLIGAVMSSLSKPHISFSLSQPRVR